MDFEGIIKFIISKVRECQKNTINAWGRGDVNQEPSLTSDFFTQLKYSFSSFVNRAFIDPSQPFLQLQVRILDDRGRNAPESKYGADIAIVLSIRSKKGLLIAKGVLIQAKKDGSPIFCQDLTNSSCNFLVKPSLELNDLEEQIKKMKEISSPASFVLVYTPSEFYIARADQIIGIFDSFLIKANTFSRFLRAFFRCQVGDFHLIETSDEIFDMIKRNIVPEEHILLQMQEKWAKYVAWFDISDNQ